MLFQDGEEPPERHRLSVAASPDLPEWTLSRLLRDRSASVREALAWRADLPHAVARVLAEDPEPQVVRALLTAGWSGVPAVWKRALAAAAVEERARLAAGMTPLVDVIEWAADEGPDVQGAVAHEVLRSLNRFQLEVPERLLRWPRWIKLRIVQAASLENWVALVFSDDADPEIAATAAIRLPRTGGGVTAPTRNDDD
jgi:hypothetical protein